MISYIYNLKGEYYADEKVLCVKIPLNNIGLDRKNALEYAIKKINENDIHDYFHRKLLITP